MKSSILNFALLNQEHWKIMLIRRTLLTQLVFYKNSFHDRKNLIFILFMKLTFKEFLPRQNLTVSSFNSIQNSPDASHETFITLASSRVSQTHSTCNKSILLFIFQFFTNEKSFSILLIALVNYS